jgi:prepilin-type N-terminal cleavage/methylation domain-containing protein
MIQIMGRQRGFTLVELLSVMAIIGVLAGVVSGSVSELGASGRFAQILSDTKTMEIAADRFFNASFPQRYPVKNPDTNGDGVLNGLDFPPLPAGDVSVRVIDFWARLPQDPTRTFSPNFIKQVPDSAAVISYRVDTATGEVFAATGGAPLIPPSDLRLDVEVADNSAGGISGLTFELTMRKNRAALETLKIQIPPAYVIGGRTLPAGVEVGSLDIYLDVDNPWRSGHVLKVSTPILTTGRAHEWEISPDYSTAISQANGDVVDTVKGAILSGGATRRSGPTLTHTLDVLSAAYEVPGELTLEMDRSRGARLPHNESRETWVLTMFAYPDQYAGSRAIITNPTKAGVYRWVGESHSTIQVEDVFEPAAGNQVVLIQDFYPPHVTPAANAPPLVNIASQSGGTFLLGESMFFVGSANDAEDKGLTGDLVWTSNLDGEIGVGRSFSTTLTEGNHTITASVSDSGSRTGFDTVSVVIQAVSREPSLVFLVQPGDTVAGAAFSPAIQVEVRDGTEWRVTDADDTIFLAIQSDPNQRGSVLSGPAPVGGGYLQAVAVGGIATFPNLSIGLPGTGFSLQAASVGFKPVLSTDFDVAANTAPVVNVTGPTSGVVGAVTPNLVFDARVIDDADDAGSLLAALEWYVDGVFVGVQGPTMNLTASLLGAMNHSAPAVGPHIIEARSLDSGGSAGEGSLEITLFEGAVVSGCGVLNAPGQTYVLVADLVAAEDSGCIQIAADNITLDGNGHRLLGLNVTTAGNSADSVGVQLTGVTGVTVKELDVSLFNVGIRVNGGRGNTITGNSLHHNTNSGVYLGGMTTGNIINLNDIDSNSLAGIHLFNSGGGNDIFNNNFMHNRNAGGLSDIFYRPIPVGGNHWSDNTPTCTGSDGFSLCDTAFGFDALPWPAPSGWRK